jgi:hypothetical protein
MGISQSQTLFKEAVDGLKVKEIIPKAKLWDVLFDIEGTAEVSVP